MDKQALWNKVLSNIKESISLANYRTWFAQTNLKNIEKGVVILEVPSSFIKQHLNNKYIDLLESSLKEVVGEQVKVEFEVNSSINTKHHLQDDSPETELEDFNIQSPNVFLTGLNPKYNLENFVVGLSNNLAYAAAQAVVANPGISYNPLFIYGGTGVGKTHLMQGIGNALYKRNSSIKIIYCSSEKFTNDFIQSIQNKRTGEFRSKYRSCNLLLIDDIQFIAGRDSTQEEFFHTFNELHSKNSQVVLTSDRPPEQMQDLEQRLRSRFQGGLMVDIQLPDFDTRVAILRAKCQEKGDIVGEEVLTLIAESNPTNARELEGKLIQLLQVAKLSGESLNLETVRKYLGRSAPQSEKLDYKKVISSVNNYFNIRMADLTGPRRNKGLVVPRQLVMYLLYEECRIPYERIGQLLGGRDHTTILHGVEKIREAVNRDRDVQRILIELKQNITSL